jgi:hypothetical protein
MGSHGLDPTDHRPPRTCKAGSISTPDLFTILTLLPGVGVIQGLRPAIIERRFGRMLLSSPLGRPREKVKPRWAPLFAGLRQLSVDRGEFCDCHLNPYFTRLFCPRFRFAHRARWAAAIFARAAADIGRLLRKPILR